MREHDELMSALEARQIDIGIRGEDSLSVAYRAFKAAPNPVAQLEQERDALQAENDRLKATNSANKLVLSLQPRQFTEHQQRGFKWGMERAAEIAETDTFAPPYGKRIADAIRAEIDK